MQITADDLNTVGAIYEAAIERGRWSQTLDAIANKIGATGCNLTAIDARYPECRLDEVNGMWSIEATEAYNRDVAPGEAQYWQALKHLPPLTVIGDAEFFKDRAAYDALPMVRWGIEHMSVYNRAVARLNGYEGWIDGLAVQYHMNRAGISASERDALGLFLPHLAKAIELQRPFRILEARFRAVLAALDRIHTGMIVLTNGMDVVISNKEAQRLMDARGGLWIDRAQRLCCPPTVNLREAVTAVQQTARAEGTTRSRYLTVPAGADRSDLLVEVVPLRDHAGEIECGFQGSLVIVIDPDNQRALSADGLREMHNLTAAENETCQLLLQGLTLNDIAEKRGVGLSTVRSHIKSLLHKTGCNRQSALIRLAVTTNPPIDSAE